MGQACVARQQGLAQNVRLGAQALGFTLRLLAARNGLVRRATSFL